MVLRVLLSLFAPFEALAEDLFSWFVVLNVFVRVHIQYQGETLPPWFMCLHGNILTLFCVRLKYVFLSTRNINHTTIGRVTLPIVVFGIAGILYCLCAPIFPFLTLDIFYKSVQMIIYGVTL